VARLGVERPLASISIDHPLLLRLRAEAAKRHMPTDFLIRSLLDTIVADRLVSAVLDE
jgi:hypothetical protein